MSLGELLQGGTNAVVAKRLDDIEQRLGVLEALNGRRDRSVAAPVIHFIPHFTSGDLSQGACMNSGALTPDPTAVTCKLCRRTIWYRNNTVDA